MRDIETAVASAAAARVVRPVFLASLDFQSDPLYAASTPFNIEWNGEEWLGLGTLGGIGAVEESVETKATQLGFSLSGVPTRLLAKAVSDSYQGRDARLYTVPLDAAYAMAGTPVLLFRGRMDTMRVRYADGVAAILVTVANRLADWERPRIRRYTNEDQQAYFAGDKGCEFVPAMADKNIVWGRG